VNGCPVSDCHKFFDRSPASLFLNLRIPLTQCIGYDTAHALPGRMGDCLGEAMRFGIFHIETHEEALHFYLIVYLSTIPPYRGAISTP
jgi:hypothetical protein